MGEVGPESDTVTRNPACERSPEFVDVENQFLRFDGDRRGVGRDTLDDFVHLKLKDRLLKFRITYLGVGS